MTGGFRDEVVDDSEPERETWRREREALGIFTPRARAKPSKPAPTREVIELTDEESDSHLQPTNVIDISGNATIEQPLSTIDTRPARFHLKPS